MEEDWKTYPDYPYLAFSNKGRIFNLETQRYLKIRLGRNAPCISIYDFSHKRSQPLYVAKIFASLFLKDTPKKYVIYKDGNHSNLAANNLMWSDQRNPQRYYPINSSKQSICYSSQVRCIETGETFSSVKQLATDLGYSIQTIYNSINQKKKIPGLGLSFEYV